MKTSRFQSWKGRAIALFLLGLIAGCSSTMRQDPPLRPRFVADYRKNSGYKDLKRLPVKLDFHLLEKRDKCIMVDSESTFGDPKIDKLPFKSIVKEEFKEFISTNFYLVGNDKQSRLVLEVVSSSDDPITRSPARDIKCDISFKVTFKDSTVNSTPLLFTLDCSGTAEYHDIEAITPCSLYAAIQKAVENCGDRLFENADYMKLLVPLIPTKNSHGQLAYDDPVQLPVGNGSYYYKQRATVACNDDNLDDVKKWAKREIKERLVYQRYFKDPCVFFRQNSKVGQEGKVLEFYYDVIERHDFIVIPDRTMSGRTGRCFVNYRNLKLGTDKEIREYMQNWLLAWFKANDDSAGNVDLNLYAEDEDNVGFRMAEYERK